MICNFIFCKFYTVGIVLTRAIQLIALLICFEPYSWQTNFYKPYSWQTKSNLDQSNFVKFEENFTCHVSYLTIVLWFSFGIKTEFGLVGGQDKFWISLFHRTSFVKFHKTISVIFYKLFYFKLSMCDQHQEYVKCIPIEIGH